ncbi:hypothetical protein GA0061096_4224 [Fictibacillus enclensis]|nr:hypothetical protein GA0061096_4224 [Fictibacillus enclensis]
MKQGFILLGYCKWMSQFLSKFTWFKPFENKMIGFENKVA